eukprot:356631-Chlamydomonas_euryale.AAC.1
MSRCPRAGRDGCWAAGRCPAAFLCEAEGASAGALHGPGAWLQITRASKNKLPRPCNSLPNASPPVIAGARRSGCGMQCDHAPLPPSPCCLPHSLPRQVWRGTRHPSLPLHTLPPMQARTLRPVALCRIYRFATTIFKLRCSNRGVQKPRFWNPVFGNTDAEVRAHDRHHTMSLSQSRDLTVPIT